MNQVDHGRRPRTETAQARPRVDPIKSLHRWCARTWRKYATPERRTRLHLWRRGFLCRRELAFVTGRKPDFLTFGRGRMWVEVKALDPPTSQQRLSFAHEELKRRLDRVSGNYAVDAWFSVGFDHGTAKRAVQLISREVSAGLNPDLDLYVGVPASDTDHETVTLDWTAEGGKRVRMIALRTKSNVYGCPPAAEPRNWSEEILIQDGTTAVRRPAFRVLSVSDRCKVTCRILPMPRHVGLAMTGNAEASDCKTVERLRDVIDDAANQLRNAQSFRPASGIVEIYNDHLGGDHLDLLRACLGDLTIAIDPRTSRATDSFYGENGILRAGKNTAVSAVTYRSRLFPTVSVIHSDAAFPIKATWLDGQIYLVINGKVSVVRDG